MMNQPQQFKIRSSQRRDGGYQGREIRPENEGRKGKNYSRTVGIDLQKNWQIDELTDWQIDEGAEAMRD
jgi:hypothetical protein